MKIFFTFLSLFILSLILPLKAFSSINPYIDSLNPKQNAINVSLNSNIIVYFSQTMNSSTLNNSTIKVFSYQRGFQTCTFTYNSANKSLTMNPSIDFRYGEQINISLTAGVQTSGGTFITPFVFFFLVKSANAPATFAQYSSVGTGSWPEYCAEGDFNNNGSLDLAVCNRTSNNVSILINNGTGNFTNSATLTAGTEPRYVISADFDKDGFLDLAEVNNQSNSLIIYRNTGGGIFTPISSMNLSGGCFCIAQGDFFNDGNIHLAVANYSGNNISILKNNGSGNFSLIVNYFVPTGPVNLVAGDLNNDGKIDLAVASWNVNSISILLNSGNGGFSVTSSYPSGTHPHSIAMGDFDKDNCLDLAIANSDSYNIFLFKNNGNGTFYQNASLNIGTETISVASADLNGDGNLDLAASSTSTGLSVYLNNGSGTLTFSNSFSVATSLRRLTVFDFDNDGKMDIAAPTANNSNILLLKNTFAPPPAPILAYPINGATGIALTPSLIWYGINGVSGYKVQVSNSYAFTNIIDSATVTTNQYSVPSGKLSNLTTYYWRVNASNTYGTGPWSTIWNFTTIMTVPPAPILISPSNNSIGVSLTPTLFWGAITGVTNYKVLVSIYQNFSTLVDSAIRTTNQYQIPNGKLSGAVQYFWKVNATNSIGTGPWSDVWNFSTLVIGVNCISSEIPKEFKLYSNYPNPFNPVTKIKFDVPKSSNIKLLVFDNLGREIVQLTNQMLQPGSYEVQWNAEAFSSGIYFYRFVTADFVETKKMLLIK